jgi:peptidoglycan/xylan/chitin deacetylase (PgdA/CDA1 family)
MSRAELIRSGLAWAGRTPPATLAVAALDWLSGSLPGVFAVLTYHRVADPSTRPWLYPGLISASPAAFERQMELVARHFKPVSMDRLMAAWRGETELPRRAILITFDDAYVDFQENAWPVLRRTGIPVTMFVPTAYPDEGGSPFWWDRLWAALLAAKERADLGDPFGSVLLSTAEKRSMAARWLIDHHQAMDHDAAMASVDAICRRLGQVDGGRSVLSWAELRTLAAGGVSLAPHSHTHPLLTRIAPGTLEVELTASREELERYAQDDARTVATNVIAYPAGAFDDRVVEAAAGAGYHFGFTTKRGVNRLRRTHPRQLRRINVGARSDANLVRAQVVLGTIRCRLSST